MNLLWKVVAKVVSQPKVADYLINRAQRTPYFHLPGYMDRWWLFNGYGNDPNATDAARHTRPISWLPSIRVHHILRADIARDKHDHPWDARTIILKSGYVETRLENGQDVKYTRLAGDTATLKFGEYHHINFVPAAGVWTLFITYKYRGTWGFLVNGVKVPWRQYTNGGAA